MTVNSLCPVSPRRDTVFFLCSACSWASNFSVAFCTATTTIFSFKSQGKSCFPGGPGKVFPPLLVSPFTTKNSSSIGTIKCRFLCFWASICELGQQDKAVGGHLLLFCFPFQVWKDEVSGTEKGNALPIVSIISLYHLYCDTWIPGIGSIVDCLIRFYLLLNHAWLAAAGGIEFWQTFCLIKYGHSYSWIG